MKTPITYVIALAPGVALCAAIAAAGYATEQFQRAAFGAAPIDAFVAAILVGIAVRAWRAPSPVMAPGVGFSAKQALEAGVALLGAEITVASVAALSTPLLLSIAAVVAMSLLAGYAACRAFGLSRNLSLLIACGNSICGNSAIAAVAPVIRAEARDVTSAIAFTAVWGVPLVLALPALSTALGVEAHRFGVFAGLTVYSVPQVLAATLPVGALAVQIGTLTKLIRVLLLAPVTLAASLLFRGDAAGRGRAALTPPWFIFGFFLLMGLRSMGWIPQTLTDVASSASRLLTLLAMAALGLGTDARLLLAAGGRVSGATLTAMATLAALAAGVAWRLG